MVSSSTRWVIDALVSDLSRLPSSTLASTEFWTRWAASVRFVRSLNGVVDVLNKYPHPTAPLTDQVASALNRQFGPTFGPALLAGWTSDPVVMAKAAASSRTSVVAAVATNPHLSLELAKQIQKQFLRYAAPAAIVRPELIEWLAEAREDPKDPDKQLPVLLTQWLPQQTSDSIVELFKLGRDSVPLARFAVTYRPPYRYSYASTSKTDKATQTTLSELSVLLDVTVPQIRQVFLDTGKQGLLAAAVRSRGLMESGSQLIIDSFEQVKAHDVAMSDNVFGEFTYEDFVGSTRFLSRLLSNNPHPLRNITSRWVSTQTGVPSWVPQLALSAAQVNCSLDLALRQFAYRSLSIRESVLVTDLSDSNAVKYPFNYAVDRSASEHIDASVLLFEAGLGLPVPLDGSGTVATLPGCEGFAVLNNAKTVPPYDAVAAVLAELAAVAPRDRVDTIVELMVLAAQRDVFMSPLFNFQGRNAPSRLPGTQQRQALNARPRFGKMVGSLEQRFVDPQTGFLVEAFTPLAEFPLSWDLMTLLADRFTPHQLVVNLYGRYAASWKRLWRHPQAAELFTLLFTTVEDANTALFRDTLQFFIDPQTHDSAVVDTLLSLDNLSTLCGDFTPDELDLGMLTVPQLYKLAAQDPTPSPAPSDGAQSRAWLATGVARGRQARTFALAVLDELITRDEVGSSEQAFAMLAGLPVFPEPPQLAALSAVGPLFRDLLVEDLVETCAGDSRRWVEASSLLDSGWESTFDDLKSFIEFLD